MFKSTHKIVMLMVIFIMALFIMPLFAQTTGTDPGEVMYPSAVFESIAAFAGAVLVLTAFAKKQLKTNDTITVVLSGLISFALAGLGYYFQYGIFVAVEWWYIFIYGLTAMLVANGLSSWEFIKMILIFFKLKTPADKI